MQQFATTTTSTSTQAIFTNAQVTGTRFHVYWQTPYYYAQSQQLPENARGAKAITKFASEVDTAGIYDFNGECSLIEVLDNDTNGAQVPCQSPNNPVLEFEAGAVDGDYWFVHCQVDRATLALECGQPPDRGPFPETDYLCGYTYQDGSTTHYWNYAWFLGGTPTGSNCQTFTNYASIISDSNQDLVAETVDDTIDGL